MRETGEIGWWSEMKMRMIGKLSRKLRLLSGIAK
jgi:hypothetical protein